MKRVAKYVLAVVVVLIVAAVALFMWSAKHDQQQFAAAKNACERGCIQDSGGIEQCRTFCEKHPDHYP